MQAWLWHNPAPPWEESSPRLKWSRFSQILSRLLLLLMQFKLWASPSAKSALTPAVLNSLFALRQRTSVSSAPLLSPATLSVRTRASHCSLSIPPAEEGGTASGANALRRFSTKCDTEDLTHRRVLSGSSLSCCMIMSDGAPAAIKQLQVHVCWLNHSLCPDISCKHRTRCTRCGVAYAVTWLGGESVAC